MTVSESDRQQVLDAAAELQMRRSEVAGALARGDTSDGEIVGFGREGINDWLSRATHACSELLSVRPTGRTKQLLASVPNNRAELARGMRMTSVFDYDGLDPEGRLLLSAERDASYLFGFAPIQLKILDGECLVLQGPFIDEEMTVMTVSSPACVSAAWAYWRAVLESSFPAVEAGQGLDHLTDRQRQIVALLATDAKDDSIAASLSVSVRTVRADVAAVLTTLGVRSRFAAGLRVRQQVSLETSR